jgi:hypothetical protein
VTTFSAATAPLDISVTRWLGACRCASRYRLSFLTASTSALRVCVAGPPWRQRICSCVSSWLFQEREKKAAATTSADRFVLSKLARSSTGAAFGHRQTSDVDRLASSCVPPLLALEIETCRAATGIGRGKAFNSSNGSRKSDLHGGISFDHSLLEYRSRGPHLVPESPGAFRDSTGKPAALGVAANRWGDQSVVHAAIQDCRNEKQW